MNDRLSKFIAEFKESSRSSKRTERLFAVSFVALLPLLFSRTPMWLFAICAPAQAILFIAAAVSLVLDNRKARKFAEGPRARPGRCHVCDYDLRGSGHAMICPECGTPFEIRANTPLFPDRPHDMQGRRNST